MTFALAQPVRRLVEARNELIAEAQPGADAAQALTRITDKAVSALAEAAFAGLKDRWAVLATGSYGARRLLPYSDIDLLIVVRKRTRESDAAARQLLYPLWDAGFEVGYAIRTPGEQRAACRKDFETLTAIVPGRALAGDLKLAREVRESCILDARSRRTAVSRVLASRVRTGTPFDLWPDLKNGAGGQRDIDELDWRHILLGSTKPDLSEEQGLLLAARWALHVAAGRSASTLSSDYAAIGSARLHRAMGRIASMLSIARAEIPADAAAGEPWTPVRVLDACDAGEAEFEALAYAALHGSLDGIVPGMSFLMTARRPALGHRFTVGAHCIKTALLVRAMYDSDALARSLCPAERLPTVIATALAHDAGKAIPGPGHAERSAGPAAHAALAITGSETEAADAAWLAREHLLLSTFAERADIDDPQTVAACAARVPTRILLGPLYLLTAADHAAVASGVWDAWHATLVKTLVRRVDAALVENPTLKSDVEHGERIRASAASMLADEPQALLALSRFPTRALFDRDVSEVVDDARALAAIATTPTNAFEMCISPGPIPEAFAVRIASSWRPRLLEEAAGCCTLVNLDILDARLAADAGELALISLVVRAAAGTPVLHDTWMRFDRLFAAAVRGELDLAARLAAALPSARRPHELLVRWDVRDPSASVLHVRTDDRPGLLFTLARAVHDEGLVTVSARAIVRDGMAIDTLRVVDDRGAPIASPGSLGHIAMRVREKVGAA